MARSQSAFLNRSDVPARDALQKAIDALKLKVTLDDGYAPFESKGYLPCTIDGEDSGFNIRFHDVDADLDALPALKGALGGRDVAIDFKWSGDVREKVSAMAVCAALATSFGAVVHMAEGDKLLGAEKLTAEARAGLEEL